MKVKLLRKIHKRYAWYFNKEGYPVLLDVCKKKVILFDLEYCMAATKCTAEDVVKLVHVPHQEWALRHMKTFVLGQYGWSTEKARFRAAFARYRRKQKRNT